MWCELEISSFIAQCHYKCKLHTVAHYIKLVHKRNVLTRQYDTYMYIIYNILYTLNMYIHLLADILFVRHFIQTYLLAHTAFICPISFHSFNSLFLPFTLLLYFVSQPFFLQTYIYIQKYLIRFLELSRRDHIIDNDRSQQKLTSIGHSQSFY